MNGLRVFREIDILPYETGGRPEGYSPGLSGLVGGKYGDCRYIFFSITA